METRSDIVESFYQLTRKRPDDLAIGDHKNAISFAELDELVSFFRARIASVIGNSNTSIVAFALANGASALAAELAIWAEGHTALALPGKPTRNEAKNYLSAVTPHLLIISDEEQVSWIHAATEINGLGLLLENGKVITHPTFDSIEPIEFGQDILQIQFTSGSSGIPKALGFSPLAVSAGIINTQDWYNEFPIMPAFSILPQYHAMGRAAILECLWSGRGVLTSDSMAFGEHKRCIANHNCGLIISNPTYVRFGLQIKLWQALPNINRFILGTAPVEPELPVKIREQLPQACVDLRYGVSEAVGALTRLSLKSDSLPHTAGHVGEALPLVQISTQGDHPSINPVKVKSDTCATLLIKGIETTPISGRDTFIEVGDLGEYTEEKQLYLHGRSNVFLKHRGYRIDPVEIETAVLSIDSVLEAVAVGAPNQDVGEKIIVLVESENTNPTIILQQCKERLSAYKVPAKIIEVKKIPRNASDKIDRRAALHYLLSNHSF